MHLQLEFVNGGYVQHDEATAHYVGMIDQTTRGHRWGGWAGTGRYCCSPGARSTPACLALCLGLCACTVII